MRVRVRRYDNRISEIGLKEGCVMWLRQRKINQTVVDQIYGLFTAPKLSGWVLLKLMPTVGSEPEQALSK